MKWNAIPTLFNVPNRPKPLELNRKPPKERRLLQTEGTGMPNINAVINAVLNTIRLSCLYGSLCITYDTVLMYVLSKFTMIISFTDISPVKCVSSTFNEESINSIITDSSPTSNEKLQMENKKLKREVMYQKLFPIWLRNISRSYLPSRTYVSIIHVFKIVTSVLFLIVLLAFNIGNL